MFGYGLNRELTESHIELVREINESKAYVYSIDIPSDIILILVSYVQSALNAIH